MAQMLTNQSGQAFFGRSAAQTGFVLAAQPTSVRYLRPQLTHQAGPILRGAVQSSEAISDCQSSRRMAAVADLPFEQPTPLPMSDAHRSSSFEASGSSNDCTSARCR